MQGPKERVYKIHFIFIIMNTLDMKMNFIPFDSLRALLLLQIIPCIIA